MFIVVSHFPTDDINCPGIECGPIGATQEQAINAWKEQRLLSYEMSGARDPEWDPDQPDSFESRIIDMASELHQKVGQKGVLFADGGEEQAYLIEVPQLPQSLA